MPWRLITREEKPALERELAAEIGKGHVLTAYTYSAYARLSSRDDVLFEVHQVGSGYRYAVVHLTWKGRREKDPHWPSTTFYSSFDEFKREVMYPDKEEWESED